MVKSKGCRNNCINVVTAGTYWQTAETDVSVGKVINLKWILQIKDKTSYVKDYVRQRIRENNSLLILGIQNGYLLLLIPFLGSCTVRLDVTSREQN
jgi:hypothetical protein